MGDYGRLKAKVRWAIEGDENSKYFHGIINKKRSNLAIRGVFVDGTWCTDPILVKKAFKDHYEARFNKPTKARLKLSFFFPNRLSTDQVADLERHVSHDEIRLAVLCGLWRSISHRARSGSLLEFFRKFWKVIGPGFLWALCLTSIRVCCWKKIWDGPFILIEVLDCVKGKKKKALFLNVDFDKAYDSVVGLLACRFLEAFASSVRLGVLGLEVFL
ncbi:hypothetical protein Tco_0556475 [Tanacetum coccineum]